MNRTVRDIEIDLAVERRRCARLKRSFDSGKVVLLFSCAVIFSTAIMTALVFVFFGVHLRLFAVAAVFCSVFVYSIYHEMKCLNPIAKELGEAEATVDILEIELLSVKTEAKTTQRAPLRIVKLHGPPYS